MRGESLFPKKVIKEEVVEANVGFDEGMGEKGRTEAGKFQNEKGAGSGNASFNPTRIEENGSNFNEKINGLAAGGSMSHPRTEETRGLRDEGPYSIGMVHAMEVKENDPSGCEKKYKKPERKKLMAEAVSPSNRMVSSMPSGGRHASGQFIEISDSDDETPTGKTGLLASKLKRKRESSINVSESENDDAYNPTSGKRKMKQLKELIHEPRGLPGDYCSAASAASGGKIVDKSITPSRQNSEVLRRCEDKTGSKQNSDCHVSGSFLKVLDGCDSDDGSTDSTTDSEDDRFLSQFG
ncbi:hypothetical protein L1049_022771 [Liquidambar formosana]|uniref:Uncharacterized protein n=1 Tax=Liquidambar formosana TaxID=63359 RepID=A0AAP0RDI0_LIQFO